MAALTIPAVGNGTTIAMTGLGQTTLIKKISGLNNKLATFETSDLSTTDFKTFKKDTLADPGKFMVEMFWTGAALTLGNVNTATITWPSAGSMAGTAIVTDVKYPDAENGVAMSATVEISFDGYTGPTLTIA